MTRNCPQVLATVRAHLGPGAVFVGDFALSAGRKPYARQLAAERSIGGVTYRKFTASERLSAQKSRATWAFECWHDETLIEAVEESFEVHVRDSASCQAVLAAHGFALTRTFGDYAGNAFQDDDSAGRFVFVARHI